MTKRLRYFTAVSAFSLLGLTSCSELKGLLSGDDIAGALKEALIQGVNTASTNASSGSLFNGNNILTAVLPEGTVKVINTLQTLGLGGEITRFSNTLTAAATKSAEKSVPVFIEAIRRMTIRDAAGILGGGYNAATTYLRSSIGDSLRNAIKPEVTSVLAEYKLPRTLGDIAGKDLPVIGKQSLNIDFTSVLSQLVANQMFKEVEAQEYKIRTDVTARSTELLKRVFGSSKAFKN